MFLAHCLILIAARYVFDSEVIKLLWSSSCFFFGKCILTQFCNMNLCLWALDTSKLDLKRTLEMKICSTLWFYVSALFLSVIWLMCRSRRHYMVWRSKSYTAEACDASTVLQALQRRQQRTCSMYLSLCSDWFAQILGRLLYTSFSSWCSRWVVMVACHCSSWSWWS